MSRWQAITLYLIIPAAMLGLMVAFVSVDDTGVRIQPLSKKDASTDNPTLGPVQEVTCEGVNISVCMVHANYLCGEGKWVPAAYPGDSFAMGRWIHDGGCYTGQAMLIRCKGEN